jgi:Asp/Glu/hydantoin racemase
MMKRVAKAGYNVYGHTVGVLILETSFPRIPGSIGNLNTFSFPVVYKVVKRTNVQNIILDPDMSLISDFVQAGRELESEGVKGITTSCGFLGMFQEEVADAVDIPVFCSSLLQVPMALRMIRRNQKVGVITADSRNLSEKNLKPVGIDKPERIAIAGMENCREFWEVFFENKPLMDIQQMEQETVDVAVELKKREDIGAIVIECSTLPPFAPSVQRATGLPVFDFVTLTNLMHEVIHRNNFPEHTE